MIERAVCWVLLVVFFLAVCIGFIEYLFPLNAKFDLNSCCREYLLKMEKQGGLTAYDTSSLQGILADKGFTNVNITVSQPVKQGNRIEIRVEVDYAYTKLSGIFTRSTVIQHMVYNKYSASRVIVN